MYYQYYTWLFGKSFWKGMKVKVIQSCPTLRPHALVHAILQARILEWVALPFSGDLPNPGIKPRSPVLQADSLPAEPQGKRHSLNISSGGVCWWNLISFLCFQCMCIFFFFTARRNKRIFILGKQCPLMWERSVSYIVTHLKYLYHIRVDGADCKGHQNKNWPGAQKAFCHLLLTTAAFDLSFLADWIRIFSLKDETVNFLLDKSPGWLFLKSVFCF